MDLVTRLRTYIDHIAMPVTQFADTCGIPRPSMSQLLSGRNKKVSNELIAKIHDAFPELNVLWLMFGQGDMLIKKINPVSEPQINGFRDQNSQQTLKSQHVAKTVVDLGDSTQFGVRKNDEEYSDDLKAEAVNQYDSSSEPLPVQSAVSSKPSGQKVSEGLGAVRNIVQSADRSKRIVNIIVYYSDNSFEAFVPEQN